MAAPGGVYYSTLSLWDTFRGVHPLFTLLVPERVLAPDDVAVEILKLCDGTTSVGTIADELAAKYVAPRAEILTDVIGMLQDLADSGFLVDAPGGAK